MVRRSRVVVATAVGVALGLSTPCPADEVFDLGVVSVEAAPSAATTPAGDVVWLDPREDPRLHGRGDAASALSLVPGVTLVNVAGRAERTVYVRGFDLRQVPLLVDGIPVYVPYDGTLDVGRLATFDLGDVQVSRGLGSVLFGPNALGGAINLVTRRPTEPFEGRAGTAFTMGDGTERMAREAWFDVGGLRDRGWYYQVSGRVLSQDGFPLSGDFQPSTLLNAGRPLEDGGLRENSDAIDRRVNLKVGRVTGRDEFALAFITQDATKGVPPYAGSLPAGQARFWRYPWYDKRSLYFIGKRDFGRGSYLKSRVFYDAFDNGLWSYNDSTYSTQTLPAPPGSQVPYRSVYDDYTLGCSFEYGLAPSGRDSLKLALLQKDDVHREHDELAPTRPTQRFEDETWSLALENTHQVDRRLDLVLGVSVDRRDTLEAQNVVANALVPFPRDSQAAFNSQVVAEYRLRPGQRLFAGVGQRTRFATLKERYSYRLGRVLPNPALQPETALTFEVGWNARLTPRSEVRAAVFMSELEDAILQAPINPLGPNGESNQLQNVGEVDQRGFELGWTVRVGNRTEASLQYTYLDRESDSTPRVTLTDIPRCQVSGHVQQRAGRCWTLDLSVQGSSSRLGLLSGSTYGEASGYGSVDFSAAFAPDDRGTWCVDVTNLFDRDIELVPGYPEAGRLYRLSYKVRF